MNPEQLSPEDSRWMGMALDCAAKGEGRTAPNPMVGAVIVRNGEVLAEGHTQPVGQDHAEVNTLKKLGGRAEGATLYVTLEPCCHFGRTPPCTDALIRAGLARVVVGTIDPFPLVAGQGIARLRAAGISVTVGVREEECRRMMLGFLRATLLGLPAVTLKAAISLDGRIATTNGQSRWITGPAARAVGHQLRDRADAILVGMGTVLTDDPELTTRIPGGRDAQPVVLDSQLRIPPQAKLLTRKPLIFCGPEAHDPGLPADIIRVPLQDGRVSMAAALRVLAQRGYHRILAEGGGQIHRSLLDGGFVDRLELFINGRILAGGPSFVAGPGFSLSDAPDFRFVMAQALGDDLHCRLQRSLDDLLPPDYSSGAIRKSF